MRERSRSTATAASTLPLLPVMGAVTMLTGIGRPSAPEINASASDRLSPVRRVSLRCRASDESGGKISFSVRPWMRRADLPASTSAAEFQRMILKASSTPTTASGSPERKDS